MNEFDFVATKPHKDFFERMAELMKDDKELHDAFVRLLNGAAEGMEIRNFEKREKLRRKYEQKEIVPQ